MRKYHVVVLSLVMAATLVGCSATGASRPNAGTTASGGDFLAEDQCVP
jgi:hypothetical protein